MILSIDVEAHAQVIVCNIRVCQELTLNQAHNNIVAIAIKDMQICAMFSQHFNCRQIDQRVNGANVRAILMFEVGVRSLF